MESIIIKPERVFQEGYRYYISYITHPVKWKSALRKWYFIKYVRDLDLFSFERQHYPYNSLRKESKVVQTKKQY